MSKKSYRKPISIGRRYATSLWSEVLRVTRLFPTTIFNTVYTAEGLARSRRSRWKHGLYSAEALAERKRVRELLTQSRELLKQMEEDR
jgi:hypothetical protein